MLWLSYAPLHEITSCSLVGPLAHFLSSTTRCKAHKIEWVREKGEETLWVSYNQQNKKEIK